MEFLLEAYGKIVQWPVIVQGALGSALFALVVFIVRHAFSWAVQFLSKHNKKFRKERLFAELFQRKYLGDSNHNQKFIVFFIYQSLSFITRGLVFFCIGMLLGKISTFLFVIGTTIFLIYILRASLWLDPFVVESKEAPIMIWKRIAEIEIELYGKSAEDTKKKIAELSAA